MQQHIGRAQSPTSRPVHTFQIHFLLVSTNANDDIVQKDIKDSSIQHADQEKSRYPKARQ